MRSWITKQCAIFLGGDQPRYKYNLKKDIVDCVFHSIVCREVYFGQFLELRLRCENVEDIYTDESNKIDECSRCSYEEGWQAIRDRMLQEQSDVLEKQTVSSFLLMLT